MRTPRLQLDRQQWLYDYVMKESGCVFHWDEAGRELPASVKSHGQIAKRLGRIRQRIERVASEEEAAGHRETAFELYFRAAAMLASAQHPVLETSDAGREPCHTGQVRRIEQRTRASARSDQTRTQ